MASAGAQSSKGRSKRYHGTDVGFAGVQSDAGHAYSFSSFEGRCKNVSEGTQTATAVDEGSRSQDITFPYSVERTEYKSAVAVADGPETIQVCRFTDLSETRCYYRYGNTDAFEASDDHATDSSRRLFYCQVFWQRREPWEISTRACAPFQSSGAANSIHPPHSTAFKDWVSCRRPHFHGRYSGAAAV